MNTDYFEDYVSLLRKYLALKNNSLQDTDLAASIKAKLKQLYFKLTPKQREQVDMFKNEVNLLS